MRMMRWTKICADACDSCMSNISWMMHVLLPFVELRYVSFDTALSNYYTAPSNAGPPCSKTTYQISHNLHAVTEAHIRIQNQWPGNTEARNENGNVGSRCRLIR